MIIWIITAGESLPIDGANTRIWRSGSLAEILARRGHSVTLWTSTFFHAQKKQRFKENTAVKMKSGYNVNLLHAPGYSNNVSVLRLVNHWVLARQFIRWTKTIDPPDLILSSFPIIELSHAAVKLGKANKIPVVVDVRDLWPDIFLEFVPLWAKSLVKIALTPYFHSADYVFKNAFAIIGVTKGFVEWGLAHTTRKKTEFDKDFSFGYSDIKPEIKSINDAYRFWKEKGLDRESKQFVCCFFGQLGRQFDIATVIRAAKRVAQRNVCIKFVICGSGENLDFYRKMASECSNVILPGWIRAPEIWALMSMSSFGLAPYKNSRNFTLNLPNKAIEYFSAGLPVACSINGVLADLIVQHECGFQYRTGDDNHLAELLIDAFDNKEKLREMSLKSRDLFLSCFTIEKTYGELACHLEKTAHHWENKINERE